MQTFTYPTAASVMCLPARKMTMKTMLTAALLVLLFCGPAAAQFGGTPQDTTTSFFEILKVPSTGSAGIQIDADTDNIGDDDAFIEFRADNQDVKWNIGVDQSDSDKFKIDSGNDLGTFNEFQLEPGGDLRLLGDLYLHDSGGAQYPVLDVINPSTNAAARPMIRVGQDTTAALEIYRLGSTATMYLNANQAGADIKIQLEDQTQLHIEPGQLGLNGTADANVAIEINHALTRANVKSFLTAEDATDGTEIFTLRTDASGNAIMDMRDASGNQDIQLNAAADSWINSGNGLAIGKTTAAVDLDVAGQGAFASPSTRTLSLDYTNTGGFVWQAFKRGGTEKWWFSSDSANDDFKIQDVGGAGAIPLSLKYSTGHVGVGTASPDRTLTLYEASGGTIIHLTDAASGTASSDGMNIHQEGVNGHISVLETGSLYFGTDNTTHSGFTSAGDLGVGDTTPDAKLDVYNSVDENVAALFEVAGQHADVHLKDGNTTSATTVGVRAKTDSLVLIAGGVEAAYVRPSGVVEASNFSAANTLYHTGDVDTYVSMLTDAIELQVGGATLLRASEAGTDSVYIGQQDDVVAIKDSHMVFLANDNDVVINGTEIDGDIDALTESGQVLAITGTEPVLYFNDRSTAAGGEDDFTIQVNADRMQIVNETTAAAAIWLENGYMVVNKGSATVDHQLEIHNGATYSELDAGEASFSTSSTPAMKEGIAPLRPAQIRALRRAYLDSIQVYNYTWRQDVLFTAADSARILADSSKVDDLLARRVDKLKARRTVRQAQLDSIIHVDRRLVRFDTLGFDTLSRDTSIAVTLDSAGVDTVSLDTTISHKIQALLDTIYADTARLVRVDTTILTTPGTVTDIERSVLRQNIKASVDSRIAAKLTRARNRAAAGAAEQRVGFMAPEAKIISSIVAPGAEKDDELNSHHILMAQVALVRDLLGRVRDLEARVKILESGQ